MSPEGVIRIKEKSKFGDNILTNAVRIHLYLRIKIKYITLERTYFSQEGVTRLHCTQLNGNEYSFYDFQMRFCY